MGVVGRRREAGMLVGGRKGVESEERCEMTSLKGTGDEKKREEEASDVVC
jgi:hypothetical protein